MVVVVVQCRRALVFDPSNRMHALLLPAADALGANFHVALLSELSKVSQFYSTKASQLEVREAVIAGTRMTGHGGKQGRVAARFNACSMRAHW